MGEVGGSRHYAGAGLGRPALWECPACGTLNTGPIEQGCPSCGSGKPGTHVGIPTRDRPATVPEQPPRSPITGSESQLGFNAWLSSLKHLPDTSVQVLLHQAWHAAIAWYSSTLPADVVVVPVVDSILVSVPRPLLERVVSELESIVDLPNEQQSPELISLIAQLKELL